MSAEIALRNLLSYSLQLGVLVGVGAALAAAFRIERPKWALAYWQALLLAALALPGLQPWHPVGGNAGSTTGDVTSLTVAVVRGEDVDWPRLALGLLVAGVLFRLVRFGVGLWSLRRYRLRSRPLPEPAGDDAAAGAGVTPRLLISPDVAAPATYGLLRPVVLLPGGFPGLPAEQQRDLVLHERLHARRRDWLLVLVEEVVLGVLWFHPATAWLVGRIRLCREQAVDEEVVHLTGSRQSYLETLVAMARVAAGSPPAPSFMKSSHLKRRVELLLKEVSMSTRKACLAVAVGPAALVLTGALAAGAFPLLAPANPEPAVVEPVAIVDREQEPKGTGVDGAEADQPKLKKARIVRKRKVKSGAGTYDPTRMDVNVAVPPPATSGVPGGVAGGVSGGVSGGVPGGVSGGVPAEPVAVKEGEAAPTTDDAAEEDEKKPRLKPPQIVWKVAPRYPEQAKREVVEGSVTLSITIEKSGAVSAVRVVSGDARLAEAAVAAVQQWRYQPLEQGPADAQITVSFSLDKTKGKVGKEDAEKPRQP